MNQGKVMAITAAQSAIQVSNGNEEIERLRTLVNELQEEACQLRAALTKAEFEREQYHHLFLAEASKLREFEDLDIPTLEAMSSRPVEMIE